MDALNIFRVGAKESRMVDFVFEELCELVSEIQSRAWKRGENVQCR